MNLSPLPPGYPPLESLGDDGFGYWLAGFLDGEACFQSLIAEPAGSVTATLSIKLRDDDARVLHEIVERTGCGRVTPVFRKNKRVRPQVMWLVVTISDALYMAHVLQRFPCRAKKRADVQIWIDLVGLRCSRRIHQRGGWGEAQVLSRQLREVKRYDLSINDHMRREYGVVYEEQAEERPIDMLWCERGEHHWGRERATGEFPRSCPAHRHIKMQTLWCERGAHLWTRRGVPGTRPPDCREHSPDHRLTKAERRELPPRALWCEMGEHLWQKERATGTAPSSCFEHRTTPRERQAFLRNAKLTNLPGLTSEMTSNDP